MSPGTLYLVPSDLGAAAPARVVPEATRAVVHRLQHFVVENPKTARSFLKAIAYPHPLAQARFEVLDEHTQPSAFPALLAPLEDGTDVGLLSEAGCPGVADPGALLVRLAHAAGIPVAPLVGPSAILLALMASGMNGQRFAFHGYLPVKPDERRTRIAQLEAQSARDDATQIFIEAPYRNQALLDSLLQTCRGASLLCLAADLTAETEFVRTKTIAAWKQQVPKLARRPAVFLLYCGAS
jgi:16S rRNA (cytidine1402-2'-O)-methyltransferase